MASSKTSSKKRRDRRKTRSTSSGSNGRRGDSAEAPAAYKSQLRQWAEALIFAFIVMLVVRTFFFDLFRIPTPSMEQNLMVGDYLFVSKLHYGTRLPMTIGVPFTQIYLQGVRLPYNRLPGFDDVDRGDPIVFNYPPEDKPIDRKMHYIKRVIGLPGDSVAVRNKVVHVNGESLSLGENMQQFWTVYKEDERYQFSSSELESLGVTEMTPVQERPEMVRIQATPEAARRIEEIAWVERVEPYIAPENSGYSSQMFPPGRGYTPDNYGPVHVPAEGQTVTLTEENWPVYQRVIDEHERHTARQLGSNSFEIDGETTDSYTFEQDYFFVMGDSRDDSEDSRFWGFVPMDHIVGKAVLTYFSWDSGGSPPIIGQIRYGRILRGID